MQVIVPSQLRSYTAGLREVEARGATLDDVLYDLDRQFPGFRFRVVDEQDRVRPHILLYVGTRREARLATPIDERETLQIVGALSGG